MTANTNWLIFGSLVVSLMLVGVRTLWMLERDHLLLRRRMGPANWDYSTSWALSATLLGGILGTILAQSGVLTSNTTYLSNAAYGGLNVFFAMTIVLAPFVYTALSKVEHPHNTTGQREPQYQGFVWCFLVATALTLWAVVGELLTVAALLGEIAVAALPPAGTGGALPLAGTVLFAVMVVFGVILLCIYVWRRIDGTVNYQKDREVHKKKHMQMAKVCGLNLLEEVREPVEAPLPSWSVF
jgi:hypothetical protein